MFQSDNREGLVVPAIKDSKDWKTGHGDAPNVSHIGRVKASKMAALGFFQQLEDEVLSSLNKLLATCGRPSLMRMRSR
jgi:hypothetical protein